MNIKKILTFVIISVLISAGMYYGIAGFVPEELKPVMENRFDMTMCVVFGVMVGVVYLVYAYKTKGITDADALAAKKNEYFYNSFTDEQKAEIEALSDEDKARFYVEYEKLMSDDKKTALSNYMFDIQTDKAPAAVKVLRKFAAVLLIAFVGYYGYGTYTEAKPALDAYTAKLNADYTNQVLNIDGLPSIEIVGTLKQRDVDAYIEKNIKTEPEFLLNNVNTIKLYDNEVAETDGLLISNGAYAVPENMSIHIDFYKAGDKETISHEASHVFDYKYGYHSVSNSQEFQQLYNTYKGTFEFPGVDQDYCNNKSEEFFAESSRLFVDEPEYLKKNCEPLYNYFANLYA